MLGMPCFAVRRRRWLAGIAVVALMALVGFAVFHAPPGASSSPRLADLAAGAGGSRRARGSARLQPRHARRPPSSRDACHTDGPRDAVSDRRRCACEAGVGHSARPHQRHAVRGRAPANRPGPKRSGRGELARVGPASAATSPGFFGLGRVDIPDLDVEWEDARAGLHIDVTGLSLHLAPGGGRSTGPLRMSGPGRIQWNDRRTTIDALEGRLFVERPGPFHRRVPRRAAGRPGAGRWASGRAAGQLEGLGDLLGLATAGRVNLWWPARTSPRWRRGRN